MKVKLKIKTSQYLDGSDFQTIESYYKGEQIEKNGNIYITFSEFDTSKERSSTIKISDEEVLLLKSGDITSRMKFREDRTLGRSTGPHTVYLIWTYIPTRYQKGYQTRSLS